MVMDEGQNTVCKNDSVSSQTDTMEKAYFLVPDTVCPHLEKPSGQDRTAAERNYVAESNPPQAENPAKQDSF